MAGPYDEFFGPDAQPDVPKIDPYHDVMVKLPVETQRLLLTILTRNDPMATGTSRKVKDVCERVKGELDALGLIPSYCAYMFIYWASQQDKEALKRALANLDQPRAPRPPSARDFFGPHGLN